MDASSDASNALLARVFLSRSPEGTEALGAALGAVVTDGTVVALVGEMGSGKTTFTRGFARGLGVEEPVSSPTFTLMQEHEGRLPLWHLDAWMVEREEALLEAGGADVLGGSGVAVIEWAEKIERWLPTPRLQLELEPSARADAGPDAEPDADPDTGQRSTPEPAPWRRLRLSLLSCPADLPSRIAALRGALEALETPQDLELVPADGLGRST